MGGQRVIKAGRLAGLISLLVGAACWLGTASADSPRPAAPVKIGYIGSLTGFAGNYGQAVLDGANLAVKELRAGGAAIEIVSEDDASNSKNTVTAFKRLSSVSGAGALITGTWWANNVAHLAETQHLPMLSCELQLNKETVRAPSHFIMGGDLKEWIWAFKSLAAERGLKRGAIVRFTSGFADTLEEEMRRLFSEPGRVFAGAVTYSDVTAGDIAQLALQVKKAAPDTVYLDAQPSSLAVMLKKFQELGLSGVSILTNDIGYDAIEQRLVNPSELKNFCFTRRAEAGGHFAEAFQREYGRKPYLSSHLGYYSARLLYTVLHDKTVDPIVALHRGQTLDDTRFDFDANNVYAGLKLQVWTVKDGQAVKLYDR
jgi:branched-chain amino acid transport system substrate-binding protein